ncbi:MAG: hypothetical protein E6Q98_23045 [Rhodospirillaceae bacterium]|nr:MAG: hypothetical protein E6Q98_23045 [Rhodospirillaceae bacterium]
MNDGNSLSVALSLRGVRNIVESVDEAFRVGYRLNRWITINWEQAEVSADFHAAQTRFWKLACEWLRRRGVPFAQVWVLENHCKTGIHGHYLVHVPPTFVEEFGRLQRRWLRKAGCRVKQGIVKSKQFPPGTEIGRANGTVRYMLKGAGKKICTALGIRREFGGTVIGKRCGASEFLSEAARTRRKKSFTVHPNHYRARMTIALGHMSRDEAENWLLTKPQQESVDQWRLENLVPSRVPHRD